MAADVTAKPVVEVCAYAVWMGVRVNVCSWRGLGGHDKTKSMCLHMQVCVPSLPDTIEQDLE